jgi:hypothetical protein
MKRKPAAPVFKPYVMNQTALLPPSYEEKISEKHLVRVVNVRWIRLFRLENGSK